MTTKIAVILLNWNNWADTLDCLQQLRCIDHAGMMLDIIVVDNHSTQPMPERFGTEAGIQFIQMSENRGFAGGNNAGICQALEREADMVLLVNTDTLLPENFLQPLVRLLQTQPSTGIVCPLMFYADYPETIWFAGGKFHAPRILGEMVGMDKKDHGQFAQSMPIDFAVGTCMLIRSAVFEAVGLLDDLFFFYHEDVDFSLRVRSAGYDIWLEPASKIYHKVAQSTKSNLPLRVYHYNRARTVLLLKHVRGQRVLPAVILDILRFFRQVIGFLLKGEFKQASAFVRGIRDGVISYAKKTGK